MYITDCVNQIVCFIYDDYIAIKLYSTGFSGGLVEKDVIWQNNQLKKKTTQMSWSRGEWYFTWNNKNQNTFMSFLT